MHTITQKQTKQVQNFIGRKNAKLLMIYSIIFALLEILKIIVLISLRWFYHLQVLWSSYRVKMVIKQLAIYVRLIGHAQVLSNNFSIQIYKRNA